MTDTATAPRELDHARLKRGGFLGVIVLIISSWIGVVIGFWFMTTSTAGLGLLPATALAMAGLAAVPIFGMIGGYVGLMRARDGVIANTKTNILPPEHPLTQIVSSLAKKMELPVPMVGMFSSPDINAFAAGSSPDKAVVSFSLGLAFLMTDREKMAVAAHELAHIANRDMRRMQFATSFQNTLTWYVGFSDRTQAFARWMLSILGELMIKRLSRTREYWADATAAAVVGREDMIAALRRLDGDKSQPTAERLAYARMMIRANPNSWFATHPSIADRIAALEQGRYIDRLPYK